MACVNKGMKGSHASRLLTTAVLNVAGLWECHGKMFSFGSWKFGGVIEWNPDNSEARMRQKDGMILLSMMWTSYFVTFQHSYMQVKCTWCSICLKLGFHCRRIVDLALSASVFHLKIAPSHGGELEPS